MVALGTQTKGLMKKIETKNSHATVLLKISFLVLYRTNKYSISIRHPFAPSDRIVLSSLEKHLMCTVHEKISLIRDKQSK